MRAVKRLALVIPICLLIIFLLLYFQFKTIIASTIHFSGVFVAFAGGFIMILVIWTGMVYEFCYWRNSYERSFPNANSQFECRCLGWVL